MRNNIVAITVLFSILTGCGGGGSSQTSNQSPETPVTQPPIADYLINNNTILHKYEAGDYIAYSYDLDETYSDGSGSAANNQLLEWSVINDPNEFSYDDDGRSYISIIETTFDGFNEIQVVEQFYQYAGFTGESAIKNDAYTVLKDVDFVLMDRRSYSFIESEIEQIKCNDFDRKENLCSPVYMSPGDFIIGTNYEYKGKSSRSSTLYPKEDDDYYDVDIKWNVAAKEVISTTLGSFETFRLEQTKEFSYQGCCTRTFYKTDTTYWYYPNIGIVQASIIKTVRTSGETVPSRTIIVDYSITNTSIPFQ